MIDQTGKFRVVLIVQATYVTYRLGDEIKLTEIFREAGVVYCSISTVHYLLAWRTWLGRDEVTQNGKAIGDKIVDGYPCNREEETVMTRSSTLPMLNVASVTFWHMLASSRMS